MSKVVLEGSAVDGQAAATEVDILDEFYGYLLKANSIPLSTQGKFDAAEARRTGKPLHKLFQLTELSAHEFADTVARFFALPRVGLPELMATDSLAGRFSGRFLRETAIFAYQSTEGCPRLVLSDPTDVAAVRAAEIVLGAPLQIE